MSYICFWCNLWLPEKWILGSWVWKVIKEWSQPEKSCNLQEKEHSNFLKLSTHDPESEDTFNNLSFVFPSAHFLFDKGSAGATAAEPDQDSAPHEWVRGALKSPAELAAERENRCLLIVLPINKHPGGAAAPLLCPPWLPAGRAEGEPRQSPAVCFLVIAPRWGLKAELHQKHESRIVFWQGQEEAVQQHIPCRANSD